MSPDGSNQSCSSQQGSHKSRLNSKGCKQVTTQPRRDKSITVQIREQKQRHNPVQREAKTLRYAHKKYQQTLNK